MKENPTPMHSGLFAFTAGLRVRCELGMSQEIVSSNQSYCILYLTQYGLLQQGQPHCLSDSHVFTAFPFLQNPGNLV